MPPTPRASFLAHGPYPHLLGFVGPRRSSRDAADAGALDQPLLYTLPHCQSLWVEAYTFGSPRVGDTSLSKLYHQHVPCSFRVVYEGDLVAGIPRVHCGPLTLLEMCTPVLFCCNPCGFREYRHMGIGTYLSRKGRGDLLLAPSPAERLVYLGWSLSVAAHSLTYYHDGLLQVRHSRPGGSRGRQVECNTMMPRLTFERRKQAADYIPDLPGDAHAEAPSELA